MQQLLKKHPLILMEAAIVEQLRRSDDIQLHDGLIGYLANASSLDLYDLDNAEQLHVETVSEWGDLVLELNRSFGVKVLGGCCGTGHEHLRYIVKQERPE